jgi:hypothetical protein
VNEKKKVAASLNSNNSCVYFKQFFVNCIRSAVELLFAILNKNVESFHSNVSFFIIFLNTEYRTVCSFQLQCIWMNLNKFLRCDRKAGWKVDRMKQSRGLEWL